MIHMSPVEKSILEYVIAHHKDSLTTRSALTCALLHANLVARGAVPVRISEDKTTTSLSAVLDSSELSKEVIRLNYILHRFVPVASTSASAPNDDQILTISVTESESHVFVSLTEESTEKFGHVEIVADDHLSLENLQQNPSPSGSFLQLDTLVNLFDTELWSKVIRAPNAPPSRGLQDTTREPIPSQPTAGPSGGPPRRNLVRPPLGGYGRSDIDPFSPPGGLGGMIFDPLGGRGFQPPSFLGGPDALPPGAVPPGSRFDPMGPGFGRPRRGNHPPDPDMAMSPGFDDPYL